MALKANAELAVVADGKTKPKLFAVRPVRRRPPLCSTGLGGGQGGQRLGKFCLEGM